MACQHWVHSDGFRWVNGKYGVGKRIDFETSVKIVEAINDGTLNYAPTYKFKHFNFEVPTVLEGVKS